MNTRESLAKVEVTYQFRSLIRSSPSPDRDQRRVDLVINN